MNIIVPIAGNSVADSSHYAKSLQEVGKKTILQYVLESILETKHKKCVIVLRKEDTQISHLDNIVKLLHPEAEIVVASGDTGGAACTSMLAVDKLDLDEPLLIVGSDQILTIPLNTIISHYEKENADAGVVTFDDVHPRWSYVKLDDQNLVVEAAEKRPISRHATAGVYYFKQGKDFFHAAKKMILKDSNVLSQYFISPCLNEMILEQKKIITFPIEKKDYYSFGHASGVEAFENYLKG